MRDELNLGDLLRSADAATTGRINADAVIRRARRRRVPRLVGAALASVCAVVVVVGGAVYGLGNLAVSTNGTASSAVDSGGTVPQAQPGTSGSGMAVASRCGYAAPQLSSTASGLVVTLDFPSTTTRGGVVTGVVTLTNAGAQRVTGSTGAPIITLSRNGIVVWHTDAAIPAPLRQLDLAHGASTSFQVVLSPLLCSKGDDRSGGLRADLPPAPAGQYQVSASVVVSVAGGGEQVSGPTHDLAIR
jgi:hypothetical protein